jgi:hypothetical protein
MHKPFCWVSKCVHDGIVNPALLFMSDKVWFHLGDFVNAHNTCNWDAKNSYAVHEVPLHDQKVGVLCAVSGWRVMGLFYDVVNLEFYVSNILEPFFLNPDQRKAATCIFPTR